MLATPQPEPPNLGGQQERELPSTGLFWLPPPLPTCSFVQGNVGKPVAPVNLLGPAGKECSIDTKDMCGSRFT